MGGMARQSGRAKAGHQRILVSPRNWPALASLPHSARGWDQASGRDLSTNVEMDFKAKGLGRLPPVPASAFSWPPHHPTEGKGL